MAFRFTPLEMADVLRIDTDAFGDERGFFMETFKESVFRANGIDKRFVQDNLSRSTKNVFRGLHWQNPPMAQGKVVGVARGAIVDIAVDIRRGSPTYGHYVSEHLSDENHRLVWVPEGFAHGFLVISNEAEVFYKVTAEYSPDHEAGVAWNDPALGIDLGSDTPILSEKDCALPSLDAANNEFEFSSGAS